MRSAGRPFRFFLGFVALFVSSISFFHAFRGGFADEGKKLVVEK